jgi:hypothetical protein
LFRPTSTSNIKSNSSMVYKFEKKERSNRVPLLANSYLLMYYK